MSYQPTYPFAARQDRKRVVKVALNPSQPREEPVGISVNDKTRFFGGVEDDGIRGFRSDAVDGFLSFARRSDTSIGAV